MFFRSVYGVLFLFSATSFADSVSTTWICSDTKGHKAIQDHQCDAAASVKEVPTVTHDQTLPEWLDREGSKQSYRSDELRCRFLRQSSSVVDRRQAIEHCKGIY